jgi:hypothetical protein
VIEDHLGQLDQQMADLLAAHHDAVQRLAEVPGLGVEVVLHADTSVQVDLDGMPGLDAVTVSRWAPIIAILLPEIRSILLARRAAAQDAAVH